jgi:hypothetical protein
MLRRTVMDTTPTRFMLAVQMDVKPEREALFQEIYDVEHIPALMRVPGVRSVHRYRRAEVLKIAIGGTIQEFAFPAEPAFSAFYELESPDVLTSEAWSKAVEQGRWSSEVRPFTSNRRHTLHKLIVPKT